MDDLIGRLVANAGVDRTAAQKAVGIIVQFLLEEGPPEKVRAPIQRVPGAGTAMALDSSTSTSSSSPSMLGAIGNLTGVGSQMTAAGVSVGRIRAVARETISFARETTGGDAVGEIVGAIPGLGRFA